MSGRSDEVTRFDRTERLVHWSTAILLIALIATGTILYIPALMLRVGHRATIVNIHVISGLLLLVPLIAGLAGPWRAALVADLRRIDRWSKSDFAFFRTLRSTGKFNAGQKLAASFFLGGMVAMVATGIIMRWSPPFPNSWARGATLVHDTVYLLLFVLVVGHVLMALAKPAHLRSMFSGRMSRLYAERYEPDWLSGKDLIEPVGRATPPPRPSARRAEAAGAGRSQASD